MPLETPSNDKITSLVDKFDKIKLYQTGDFLSQLNNRKKAIAFEGLYFVKIFEIYRNNHMTFFKCKFDSAKDTKGTTIAFSHKKPIDLNPDDLIGDCIVVYSTNILLYSSEYVILFNFPKNDEVMDCFWNVSKKRFLTVT